MSGQKLLYFINHMDWFWSHRLPLAQGAQEASWQVLVSATGAGADGALRAQGFKGLDLPAAEEGPMPLAVLKIMAAMLRQIRSEKPDLIHVITIKYAFMAGLAARLCPDVRIVHTIAGLGYLFSGEGFKPAILRAAIGPFLKLALNHKNAQVIFQNSDDLEIMVRRGFVRRERTHLIPGSGVDTAQYQALPEPPADREGPLVVMPTRLVHDKGVAIFIEAARILKQRGVQARFAVAGGTTRYNPLAITKEQMEEMTADGAAQWLGKVTDMKALYAAASLIVYPSYYREGVPKVLLEAASCGRAIVTTDHPGCRDVVQDGLNGLLVPVKDVQVTADAMEKLLRDPDLRARMGAESRKRAEQLFDVRLIVRDTLKVYLT